MKIRRICAGVALAATVIAPQAATAAPTGSPSAAVAAESSIQARPSSPDMTVEQYMEIFNAAVADGAVARGDGTIAYALQNGSELVMAAPPTKTKGGSPQDLGAGWDGWRGPYISFNRVDQSALLAGGVAALSVAVCAIPGVGWASCAALVGIVTIAAYYVNEYGRCSTSKPNLRVYLSGRRGCYA